MSTSFPSFNLLMSAQKVNIAGITTLTVGAVTRRLTQITRSIPVRNPPLTVDNAVQGVGDGTIRAQVVVSCGDGEERGADGSVFVDDS